MSECKPNEHGRGQVCERRDLQTGKLYRELTCGDCGATLNSYEVLTTTPAPMSAEKGRGLEWETLAKAFFEHSRSRPGRENALVPQDDCAAVSALIHDQARKIDALTARVAILESELAARPSEVSK